MTMDIKNPESVSGSRQVGFLIRTNSALLFTLLVILSSPLVVSCQTSLQPFAGSCKADNEISAKDRETIGQVALKFVQDALGPDPSAAYATFTADAKGNVPLEQFVSGFQNGIKPMGPYKDLRVTHAYLGKVTGGTQEQRVVCGNLSNPEGWVAVNVKTGPAEAHAIVEGQTINNTIDFVIWLIPEQGTWRVQYIHYANARMVGKSAEDLRKMAMAESAKQHGFNAFILYAAALQLTDRGPFFQLGIRPDIEKEMGEIPRPRNLQEQAPFIWTFDGSAFKVLNVGPIGVGGKIYLLVDHQIEPWAQDTEADKKNRALMAGFSKAYPEYKDAFAGLVVRAHERGGNRGFGTVDQNQK
jgi:hypothetical protein